MIPEFKGAWFHQDKRKFKKLYQKGTVVIYTSLSTPSELEIKLFIPFLFYQE